jgi:hypothetical protein
MTGFQWDDDDLEKLLMYFTPSDIITAKAIMDKNRFRRSGRRVPTAIDFQRLMLLAVKNRKAVVTGGFLVEKTGYVIRLEPQEKIFSDDFFWLFRQDLGGKRGSLTISQDPLIKIFQPLSLLPSRDYFICNFPEIGEWGKAHENLWKRHHRYWVCMREALFSMDFAGGDIGEIPKCIDKTEFVLTLQWIICQYKALKIYTEYKPLDTLRFSFDHTSGQTLLYEWNSVEELFMSLLAAHAIARFTEVFLLKQQKRFTFFKQVKMLSYHRRNKIKLYKGTDEWCQISSLVGEELGTFKTETSKMRYFGNGTWFRERLAGLDTLEVIKILTDWDKIDDIYLKHILK